MMKVRKRDVTIRYTARSLNDKTGNIPTQWIGKNQEESMSTCQGCPLLESKLCYSQYGTVGRFGLRAISKAAETGKNYTIEAALCDRHPRARYVRFGSIGDPAAIPAETYNRHVAMVRSHGLGVLSYTHFWRTRGRHLKGKALASCDSLEDAEAAVNEGWRATLHVKTMPQAQGVTEGGHNYTLCPAQRGYKQLGPKQRRRDNPHYDPKYSGMTCNSCGLCDPSRKGLDIVIFEEH